MAHHEDLNKMKNTYYKDVDFQEIRTKLQQGDSHPNYYIRDGYLVTNNRHSVTFPLCQKVLKKCHEHQYAIHRERATTLNVLKSFFYWSSIQKDTLFC